MVLSRSTLQGRALGALAWALGVAMKTNEFFEEAKAAVAARNLPLALRLLESAIRLDGEQAEFHALQARLLEETHGDRRMLIRALESAIRLNPGDVNCTIRLALACQALIGRAADDVGAPRAVSALITGGRVVGEQLVDDERVTLVSATGSVRMGQQVGPRVARRFGRTLLELGGNNAAVVTPSADLDLAVRAIVFAAAGTAGQRCTTLRRLIVHRSVADDVVGRIAAAYRQLPIGDPSTGGTLVGPLIHETAYRDMVGALEQARADGGEVAGGERHETDHPSAYYVAPAVVRMPSQTPIVHTETFAPILYVLVYDDLDDAIALNNAVPQGLSSAIFTTDMREAERFIDGSDCGITNVNIGTSGAEIGGAFGGEKQTGGGRESGSDSWKAYMRRATNTVNYSSELPLAQGVHFG